MRKVAILMPLVVALFSLGANAVDHREINSQPYDDPQWVSAKCRFLTLKKDGAYGNWLVHSLEGCTNYARLSLIHDANSAADKKESEEFFHIPSEVNFVDDEGKIHICTIESKKEVYDRAPFVTEVQAKRDGYFDNLNPMVKQLLDENMTVNCKVEMSRVDDVFNSKLFTQNSESI